MNKSRSSFATIVVAGAASLAVGQALAETPTAEAKFACAGDKTIDAVFYSDSVELKLSDGRSLTLPQTISGSGARYADADDSVVFWNKGDTAFITEGNDDNQTYSDCVDSK